ncbi:MAG: exodeoxyribonuclease III [Nanoarchaeota archaeon]
MKLVSWNVNGIRSVLGKDFIKSIEQENPDILCIQEIKARPEQVDKILSQYQEHIWNPAEKKGYAGTAIFSKLKPISVTLGKQILEDTEGRVIIAEFSHFYLVNVYTPNSQRGLLRLKHRLEWDKKFIQLLKDLENQKPIIFCGDLNVAHEEIDIARPKENVKNAGFTPEERESFSSYIKHGFIDAFRHFHLEEKNHYSWWSYMHNARTKNIGWRIDYFCISNSLKNNLVSAQILKNIYGSDHCPVSIKLNFS